MLERLRRIVVETYVGAIGLGYLLAQCVLNLVSVFSSPIAGWVLRRQFGDLAAHSTAFARSPIESALPPLINFVLLLLVWYLLMRLLYFKPFNKEAHAEAPDTKQS
jgi:hypothetical protein